MHKQYENLCLCDGKIAEDSESLCNSCKEKYNIGGYDLSKEGCGCDN